MYIRLFKRFGVVPGLFVNVSRRGLSLTAQPFRGLSFSAGRRGLRTTVTPLMGTGLSLVHETRLPPLLRFLAVVAIGLALTLLVGGLLLG